MSARPHVSAVPNTPANDIAFINFRTRGRPIRIVESEAETLRDHLVAPTMRAEILREQLPAIGSALAGAFMKLASFPEAGTADPCNGPARR